MKKIKKLAACLLALAMVFALAGCSSSSDGETTAAAETTAAETAAEETTAGAEGAEETTGAADDGETAAAADGESFKVGVIQLTEHPALDSAYEGFVAALEEGGLVEGENLEIDYQNAQNDISNCDTIATKLVNEGCDLILAIATPAAQSVAGKTTEIPILVTAVTDPASSGLVNSNEEPGTNVSGTSDLTPVAEQIDLLQQLLPDAQNIAIMYCSSEDNSIFQAELAMEACEAAGLSYEEVTVSESSQIQQVTESMIGKYDAVYIPTDNVLAEGMATVAQVTNANGLPCIVGEEGMVSNGGLATYGLNYYNLGVLTGEQALSILLEGADITTMPIGYLAAEDCVLTVNTTAAAELGIEIPEDILAEAETVE